jgi:Zn-dependent protease
MIWVALAGPAVNVVMALAAGFMIYTTLALPGSLQLWLAKNFANAVLVNVVLATFNMIPIPPLDGGRVLTGLLPLRWARRYARLEPFGLPLLIVLLFVLPFGARELGYDFHPIAELMLPIVGLGIAFVSIATGIDITSVIYF